MPRLLLLNGPPGIGKSTLARRWAAEHPPTLACDVDVLRAMIGGWRDDFVGAGALVRPAALALVGAYLAGGHDVVLPQLLADDHEIDRFEAVARDAGCPVVHVVLLDEPDAVVARFAERTGEEPWHQEVRAIVAEQGGDEVVRRSCARLERLVAQRAGVRVVRTRAGDVDDAYREVAEAFSD